MIFEEGPPIPVTVAAEGARTLGEMFLSRTARSASRHALYHRPQERWEAITWAGFEDAARRVAQGLIALGLRRGDRVAILGPTQPPWAIYDFGAQLAGMVSFGIYPKQSADQIRYLLEHSEAKVIFVDEPAECEAVLSAAEGMRHLTIVPWNESLFGAFAPRAKGAGLTIIAPSKVTAEAMTRRNAEQIQASIDPSDTAIFVYTSGTTGPPKGAMVSHANILAVLTSSAANSPSPRPIAR